MRPEGYPQLVPTLGDGVVTVRALREDDLPHVVEQSRDPATVRWTSVPRNYQPQDAREFFDDVRQHWETGAREHWVVEAEGRFAGLVSLTPRGDRAVEVGFAAHPATRGRGYVTRAVGLVCDRAFAQGRQLVLWHATVGNLGSRRVAWRTGFTITESQRAMMRGTLRTVWTGTLTADEPRRPRTPWLATPVLEGHGIRLQPFAENHVDALPATLDPANQRWMAYGSPTRDTYAAWLAERGVQAATGAGLAWAITSNSNGVHGRADTLLGGIQLHRLGIPTMPDSGMLAYSLFPQARGRRVMDRALDLVLRHAFAPAVDGGLCLRRVSARADADNLPSLAVLRRAGFREVGTERRAIIAGQGAVDAVLLDLLADDNRDAQRAVPRAAPVLRTARLTLRPWGDDDAPGPGEGPDDSSLRFMPAGVHPDASAFPEWLARQRRRAASGQTVMWCLADPVTDHALGSISVFNLGPAQDRFDAEVGYWLHPSARGHGYLPEALPAVITHAFAAVADGGLGLTRLHAATDADNHASRSVLERVGFQQWGADRQAYRHSDGSLSDGVYFELLATDERIDQRARLRRGIPEVTVEGEQVRLRPLRDNDVARIIDACSEERSLHWLAGLPRPYTSAHALEYVARCHALATTRHGVFFAVADPGDDRMLASLALMDLDGETPGQGEVGYWAHPDARGRGVMTAGVAMLVRHAFAPEDAGGLGLRRLVLRAAAGNTASQHVAEANGFVRTGQQRGAELLGDGTWDDLIDYDLLRSEWDARPTP